MFAKKIRMRKSTLFFAANLPLSRIEIDAYAKLPKKNVPIVTLDDGEGFAQMAAQRLSNLGYTDVSIFEGGVKGWIAAGGEVFNDVNVPSKSFGELVESKRHPLFIGSRGEAAKRQ